MRQYGRRCELFPSACEGVCSVPHGEVVVGGSEHDECVAKNFDGGGALVVVGRFSLKSGEDILPRGEVFRYIIAGLVGGEEVVIAFVGNDDGVGRGTVSGTVETGMPVVFEVVGDVQWVAIGVGVVVLRVEPGGGCLGVSGGSVVGYVLRQLFVEGECLEVDWCLVHPHSGEEEDQRFVVSANGDVVSAVFVGSGNAYSAFNHHPDVFQWSVGMVGANAGDGVGGFGGDVVLGDLSFDGFGLRTEGGVAACEGN